MDRRTFLTVGAVAASTFALGSSVNPFLPIEPAMAWPKGCIERLPTSNTKRLAWTVDDGWSASALRAYIDLLEDHEDLRMTMFVLPRAKSWKALAKPIRALTDTGRLQLANHTMTHYDLTHATVTNFASIRALLKARGLKTVTLTDAFGK
jgi:peptidoglycan/xylan/chitin deacetylase (PgdA/CDA1 family)